MRVSACLRACSDLRYIGIERSIGLRHLALRQKPRRHQYCEGRPAKPAKELPDYLEFGGKGTGNGLFQDAGSIAVDTKGRIYVSDDSLRVQQFDENGQFLKLWQIPANGQVYQKARTIDKIAVGSDGNLYIQLGGVILAYKEGATEPTRTIHFAPNNVRICCSQRRRDAGRIDK